MVITSKWIVTDTLLAGGPQPGQSYRCRLDLMRTQTRHMSPSHVRPLSSNKGGSPENARRLMESLSLKYEMIKLMFETK